MKLVLFTPVIAASAIGRMARLVAGALLEQGHQLTVVRTEDPAMFDRPVQDFGCPVLAWNDAPGVVRLLDQSDSIVYQIGDNFEYHQGGVHWLMLRPGVVCLHDYFLGHLFYAWAQSRRPQAHAILRQQYGQEVEQQYFEATSSAELIETMHDKAPMTEWIASMAAAVVTHSSWGVERVLRSCAGPVRTLALPYDLPNAGAPHTAAAPPAYLPDGRDFRLLTIGHINPNKRAASVVRVIGNSAVLRDRTVYELAGPIEPEALEDLTALATRLKVKLQARGRVDDATMHESIRRADAIACLRLPTLEAASASAVEAMLSGKATVVMNAGFFAELPDDTVSKVAPDNELEDLRIALERLCLDEPARRAQGERARVWAQHTFTAQAYATGLVQTCGRLAAVRPLVQMVDGVAQTLRRWGAGPALLADPATVAPLKLFSVEPEPVSPD